VSGTYAGNAGIDNLNKLLQGAHSEDSELQTIRGHLGHWYCAGDPVVWLRNDYSRGLLNGLLGRVQEVDPETRSLRVLFDNFDEPHEISTEQLIDLALAYAITCHRAQGSQTPVVIVPLYANRMMDPTWLYTAITRAERQVVLVGDWEVLVDALSRPWAVRQRQVGIVWRAHAEGRTN
jgi:exodeoxyribonuclease V alpha subunit